MCGIVAGVVREGSNALPTVLDGLQRLEYRGYDSAGVAVQSNGEMLVRRYQGKLQTLTDALAQDALPASALALGHTRWATHGAPSDANAHPHRDGTGRTVVVHNGIIENHEQLRQEFEDAGAAFSSETDSEVLAYLVARELAQGADLVSALRRAVEQAHGAYAIVAASADRPGELAVARSESPLVLGIGDDGWYAASDMPALLSVTRRFCILENGESALLSADRCTLFSADGLEIEREEFLCDWTPEQAEKGGYPHFMLKEIEEQPDVIARTAFERLRDREGDVAFEAGFGLTDEELRRFRRVRFMAMGTSYHAALLGQDLLARLAGLPGDTLNASEFLYGANLQEDDALTVVISQSGETSDTLGAMREVQSRGGICLGICNVQGSTLTRDADHSILTHAGPEIGVASTKAFTAQVVALYLLAIRLGRARGALDIEAGAGFLHDLRELRPRIEGLFSDTARAQIAAAADLFTEATGAFFLGRGLQCPIALEGALKLKEISYIHAEGYPGGEMKHGPIALIDGRFPSVAIATPGLARVKMLSNIEEIRARSGPVIAVVAQGDTEASARADAVLEVPEVPELLAPVVNVIPLQLLAYEVALRRGCDIDQPRNLAKSVTVE